MAASTWFAPCMTAAAARPADAKDGTRPSPRHVTELLARPARTDTPGAPPAWLQRLLLPLPGTTPVGFQMPGGRRVLFAPLTAAMRLLLLAVVLLAAWVAVRAPGLAAVAKPSLPGSDAVAFSTNEDAADPGGPLFDMVVGTVVSAVTGGALCALLDVTPLIGVAWAAFAWANLTGTAFELTDGYTSFARTVVSRVGLMVILVRAGLTLDVLAVRADVLRVALLSFVPLLAEATVHALVAHAVIGDSWTWAFLRGFMGAAIAPSVVVPSALRAKASRWGRRDSPVDALLAGAVIESALAVWAVSFLTDLAVPPASGGISDGVAAALGPIQLVAGPIVGFAVGAALVVCSLALTAEPGSLTAAPPHAASSDPAAHGAVVAVRRSGLHKRVGLTVTALLAVVCLVLIFAGSRLTVAGGASLAAVTVAAVAGHLWRRSGAAVQRDLLADVQARFGAAWDQLVLPALFASLGSSIAARRTFGGAFLADYAPGLAAGVATRLVVTFAVAAAVPRVGFSAPPAETPPADAAPASGAVTGCEEVAGGSHARRWWSVREAAWTAMSCLGKASIQAALGGAALRAARENAAAGASGSAVDIAKGVDLLSLASLAALVFAPLSALLMRVTGPSLLAVDGGKANDAA